MLGQTLVNAPGKKSHDRQMFEQKPLLLPAQLSGDSTGRVPGA
jgi:hypothetical protein